MLYLSTLFALTEQEKGSVNNLRILNNYEYFSWTFSFRDFYYFKSNVTAVREMIEVDLHMIYHKIQASMDIGVNQTQSILHKHLRVSKLRAR